MFPQANLNEGDDRDVENLSSSSRPLIEEREHFDQTPSKTAERVLLLLRRYLLLLGNIVAWYTTNGMNGISMQSFATKFPPNGVTPLTKFLVTVLVTALQLLLGALLGRVLLSAYRNVVLRNPDGLEINFCETTTGPTLLAVLHAAGSVCTNLGFLNGKASLVQVIKLLEPFETLLFTKLLIPQQEGDLLSTGVVSSMCLTLGAALSLLPRSNEASATTSHAILYATLSGLSLSLRNVLQRRQHAASPQSLPVSQLQDKLERSLVLFTHISWHSGQLLLVVSIVSLVMVAAFERSPLAVSKATSPLSSLMTILLHGLNVGLLSWHPLYNAFSMITLGFCSAVTHSLLNAGKRVYAILMAIIWFREGISMQTAAGLFLVTIGGCWYTVETKGRAKTNRLDPHQAGRTAPVWAKPFLVAMLLHLHWKTFRVVKLS